jgi:hypothetical protein
MNDAPRNNPYHGNILVDGLGHILSREEAYRRLLYLPPTPQSPGTIPKHIRLHQLLRLRDLHIPSSEGTRIQQTIDLAIRQSYRYRDPMLATTWSHVSGESRAHKTPRAPSMASLVTGHSGSGKTESVLRALSCYENVITHTTFPRVEGQHRQMVWLSVDVPPSGRSSDLAANLMTSWDIAMERAGNEQYRRFATSLARERRDGQRMLDEWRQVALSHFLGALHLDEVQNFFKLATLRRRKNRKDLQDSLELSIVEDQCLRWILTLLNTWGIPVVLSGTPDGVGALTKRLSTIQRVVAGGYHKLTLFENPEDYTFREIFFPQLLRYQYVENPIQDSDNFRQLVIELTAGVPRLIIALWFAAHRVAFERTDDTLRPEDFQQAAVHYLEPVRSAVAALRSRDPAKMRRFEDLMPSDDDFWRAFWNPQ